MKLIQKYNAWNFYIFIRIISICAEWNENESKKKIIWYVTLGNKFSSSSALCELITWQRGKT